MGGMKKVLSGFTALATIASVTVPAVAQADDVTVGVLVPLTGELGEFGKIVAGSVELGVKQVNDAGGTKCGMLRTVIADTAGSAEQAIREATKMIDTEGAVALLGPTSGAMGALVDLAKRKETVVMSPLSLIPL